MDLKFSHLAALAAFSSSVVLADDHDHAHDSEIESSLADDSEVGGFIFPELFVLATGGLFEEGLNPADLANTEHDPQNEATIQAIELHAELVLSEALTGGVYAAAFQGANSEWEATLEEAYLEYQILDRVTIGGGQFLVPFGFQAQKHSHSWDSVNQNLVNRRALNEGELISQGGRAVFDFPKLKGALTLSGGGVRTHAHHDHEESGHGHDEHDHHEEEEEEEHFDAEEAGFESWVLAVDYKFELPFAEDTTFSASFATGENGFGQRSSVYGIGFEKTWFAQHSDDDYHCSNSGVLKLRHELIGRDIGIFDEDHGEFSENDFGLSTMLQYGLSDRTSISIRHDWVSELESLELEERHRFSPALTTSVGKNDMLQARLQYDYDRSDSLGDAHTVWLQFQVQFGVAHGHSH